MIDTFCRLCFSSCLVNCRAGRAGGPGRLMRRQNSEQNSKIGYVN
jgi:hypothetical protein